MTPVEALRGTKGDLMARSGTTGLLQQPGGWLLDEPFAVPLAGSAGLAHPPVDETLVETFVVEAGAGPPVALGPDRSVSRWWQPAVDALVERVLNAADGAGLAVEYPMYVSVSTTPIERVVSEPHFDDDDFDPDQGVGLVAIVASHLGPRLAAEPVACRPPRPGLPIELVSDAETSLTGVDGGVQVPANRVVLFSRFGQLHAGARPTELAALARSIGPIRSLMVARVGTRPNGRGDETPVDPFAAGLDHRLGSGPT